MHDTMQTDAHRGSVSVVGTKPTDPINRFGARSCPNGHARSIGASADSAAPLRAALATDLARPGQLRFGDTTDGVLQMRRPIGQRCLLDCQPIDAGAEQRLLARRTKFVGSCARGTAMGRELSSFLCDDRRKFRCGQCHKQHHDQRCTKSCADQAHQNADQKAQYDPCGRPKDHRFPP